MEYPVCYCDLAMGELVMGSIDYCPQYRGIWLEKVEPSPGADSTRTPPAW